MDYPLLSVIVPVYNAEKYIKKCVDSILNQTYSNLEIILIDDGSPDNSGELCNRIAMLDNRVKVFHKKNGGQASARNLGLDNASGHLIGFVDSDDYISPKMYETLYIQMEKTGSDISCCGIERVDDNGHISYFNDSVEDYLELDTEKALVELTYNYRITSSPCDKLYSAKIFEDIRMLEGRIYEDFEIIPRCILNASKVVYTGKPMYCYYCSKNSTMRGTYSIKHYDNVEFARKNIKLYAEHFPNSAKYMKAEYVKLCVDAIYYSWGNKDWDIKRQELINEISDKIDDEIYGVLDQKTKAKVKVLKFSPKLFYRLMDFMKRGKNY